MKASEYVKRFGWGEASALVDASKLCGIDKSIVDIVELKKLVNSYDFVESYGGLDSCREKLYMLHELTEDPHPIRDAIIDVESCL